MPEEQEHKEQNRSTKEQNRLKNLVITFITQWGGKIMSNMEIRKMLLKKEQELVRGIPYKYEKPLLLRKQAKTITIRPDFTTLNKRTRIQRYHEHFGKMDDPQYARKALEKIRLYEENGLFVGEQLILTFESSEQPLDKKELELLIEKYLI